MKNEITVKRLMAVRLDSALAEKAAAAGFTLTTLKKATKKNLKEKFSSDEIQKIEENVKRNPIPDEVVDDLVRKCDWKCCVCWDIDKHDPVVIHHIEHHSKTADDSYDNLVLLCLSHHGLAHSKWEISQHPCSEGYLRERKKGFEKAVDQFKTGTRCGPGREGRSEDPSSEDDVKALKKLAKFLDRPAILRPLQREGSIKDFVKEMGNILKAFNVGTLKTRDGDDLGKVKPYRDFSNPNWIPRLEFVRNQIDAIRSRMDIAVREGHVVMNPDGDVFSFPDSTLSGEIDALKASVVTNFNAVLEQAGIRQLKLEW